MTMALEWAKIQSDKLTCKERKFGHKGRQQECWAQRDDSVRTKQQ